MYLWALILSCWGLTVAAEYETIWICPLPKCGKCPPEQRFTSPGVGFALEADHGTASVKYHNGTVEPVAHINASPAYRSLVQHLVSDAENLMPDGSRRPPGVDEKDVWTMPIWVLFHAKRLLNKLVWLPATPETKTLADMVTQLRHEVEAHLGGRITAAALTTPEAVGLTRQEIRDLFDYLGLEDLVWDERNFGDLHLHSLPATMAGYELGLCENYTHAYECALEERHTPSMHILKLDFNRHTLSGVLARAETARKHPLSHYFMDFDLGLSSRPNEEKYWEHFQSRIKEFVGSSRVDKLLLAGTHASEPDFLDAVRGALSPLQVAAETAGKDHFLYAASMGMAELAKRRLEGMARCWLPDECLNRRGMQERATKEL